MTRRLARLAVATVAVAAAGTVLPAPPATAATCDSGSGVSVVVDFSRLGGGIASTCNAGGGGDSAAANMGVDHELTRVQQFPGAVCRVDNTPADAPCRNMPPEDAYWGLFWSDGSGGWTYSSQGVDSLTIPDGGSVAFAWQDGGDRDLPGTPPPQNAAEPSSSPSPSPSQQPAGGGSGGSGGGSNGGGGTSQPSTAPTPTASGSASPSVEPTRKPRSSKHTRKPDHEKPSDGPTDGPTDNPSAEVSATPSDDPSDAVPVADPPATDDGLPAWVAPLGIAGLFAVAGVVALLRRRTVA